jgi:predicted nucleotidyltransferase
MDLGGRKELFRALVGSHNYNLNTPESDKDYKIFVAPTFDDLYFNKQFSSSIIGETEDYDIHDIRKVSHLWWKANVNFVEVLFSEDVYLNKELDINTRNYLQTIFYHKDEIARMNLPYLYDACVGMHITKKKQIEKGTAGTQHLVDKYGYDTKQALHSIRILDFLRRFADTEFTDFKKAIWYDDEDSNKQYLLDIKNGEFDKKHYYADAEFMLNIIENNYKEKYKSCKTDIETNNSLIDLVKEIVKIQIQVGD